MTEHLDQEVDKALIRLCDALCSWERATGRESVLILREQGGFQFRAQSGKPLARTQDDVSDSILFDLIDGRERTWEEAPE